MWNYDPIENFTESSGKMEETLVYSKDGFTEGVEGKVDKRSVALSQTKNSVRVIKPSDF